MPEVGLKYDKDKTRFDLLSLNAERAVAEVLTHGARKYGARNWNLVDNHVDRYIGAARRHLNAYMSGEKIDPESNIHHLAHAICSFMFILEKDLTEKPQEALNFEGIKVSDWTRDNIKTPTPVKGVVQINEPFRDIDVYSRTSAGEPAPASIRNSGVTEPAQYHC